MIKILFIGNGLTEYNNVPDKVKQLFAYAGKNAEVETIIDLEKALTVDKDNEEIKTIILNGGFDYVVFQAETTDFRADMLKSEVESIYPWIQEAKASLVFYMPWANEDVFSTEQAVLTNAYVLEAKRWQALLSPCGEVYYDMYFDYGARWYKENDLVYGNDMASLISASTIYYTISGQKTPLLFSARDDFIKNNRDDDGNVYDTVIVNLIQKEASRYAELYRDLNHVPDITNRKEESLEVKHTDMSDEDVEKILFIGNSLTEFNNVPGKVKEIFAKEGKQVEVEKIINLGQPLTIHRDDAEKNAETKAKILTGNFDYVVLQDKAGGFKESMLQNGVETIYPWIEEAGSKLVLYMPWANENILKSGQNVFTNAYVAECKKRNGLLAPSGEAYYDMYFGYNAQWYDDNVHGNDLASLISASTIYYTISGQTKPIIFSSNDTFIDENAYNTVVVNLIQKEASRFTELYRNLEHVPNISERLPYIPNQEPEVQNTGNTLGKKHLEVKNLRISKHAEKSLQIKWDKVPSASYQIEVCCGGKTVKKIVTSKCTYTIKGLKKTSTYKISVQPFCKTQTGTSYGKKTKVSAKTIPKKVKLQSVTVGRQNVLLKWKKVSGVSGYEVYMKKNNGKFKKVKTNVKGTSLNIKIKSSGNYCFRIRAYTKDSSGKVYGKPVKTKTIF